MFPTFAEQQASDPTLYVDGESISLDSAPFFALADPGGARVQVEWDAVANGYVSEGWVCDYCGHSEETPRAIYRHCRDEHGQPAHDAEVQHTRPLVNSAAIDWTGDDLTVTISTGDPRGAFAMTVRRLADGTRILHVPTAGDGGHERLTELHPGTYRIGG